MSESPATAGRRATVWTLAFALIFPTSMAWAYFLALAGTGQANRLQQIAYAAGKIIQFSIPLVFVAFFRQWPKWQAPNTGGLLLGAGFGLVFGGIFVGAYHGVLRASPLLAQAPGRIQQKMAEFGITSPLTFLALAVFLSVAHSFLEEYYWRWFVFGRLLGLVPTWVAIVLSSLGFMAHHVLILWAFLPDRIVTGVVPASFAVAVGGGVWAWLYQRAGSLLAPWISHALIDASLFVIGWDMMRYG